MQTFEIEPFLNQKFPAAFSKMPEQVRDIGGSYQLNIEGNGGGEWFINTQATTIKPGNVSPRDFTLTIASEDFVKLCENPQGNAMQLFFAGKAHVSGSGLMLTKLGKLIDMVNGF